MEAQETDERIKMFYLMVINSDFDYQVNWGEEKRIFEVMWTILCEEV